MRLPHLIEFRAFKDGGVDGSNFKREYSAPVKCRGMVTPRNLVRSLNDAAALGGDRAVTHQAVIRYRDDLDLFVHAFYNDQVFRTLGHQHDAKCRFTTVALSFYKACTLEELEAEIVVGEPVYFNA